MDLEAALRELDKGNLSVVPAPLAEASPQDKLIARRLDQLAALCASNPILTSELMPFIQGATEWDTDPDGLVMGRLNLGTVTRVIEIEKNMLRIGRDGFPERKRIPW